MSTRWNLIFPIQSMDLAMSNLLLMLMSWSMGSTAIQGRRWRRNQRVVFTNWPVKKPDDSPADNWHRHLYTEPDSSESTHNTFHSSTHILPDTMCIWIHCNLNIERCWLMFEWRSYRLLRGFDLAVTEIKQAEFVIGRVSMLIGLLRWRWRETSIK